MAGVSDMFEFWYQKKNFFFISLVFHATQPDLIAIYRYSMTEPVTQVKNLTKTDFISIPKKISFSTIQT